MQAVLVMFRSDGERRSFSVVRDMTVIGRREDCDLRIPLGEVSRKHCRMVRDGDTLRLEDLGSSNGTYLNGVRVEREATLNPGDSIQVGPVVFVLQVDGYPADDELRPITIGTAEAAAGDGEVTELTDVTQELSGANGAHAAGGSHGGNGGHGANGGSSLDYTAAARGQRQELGEEELPELQPLDEGTPHAEAGAGGEELPPVPVGEDAGFDMLMEENTDDQGAPIPMDLDLDADHHQQQARPQQ
jgi:pSer/pThr/pTyr-binding forkhead associated (FHA) protein